MDPIDWNELLQTLEPEDRRLRPGIEPGALAALEQRLGATLPEDYRSFLLQADGGWIGDLRIYGSPEVMDLIRLARVQARQPAGQAARIDMPRLLPFHPVSRTSVECLSLDGDRGEVFWCRFPDHPQTRAERFFEQWSGLRSLDVDTWTGRGEHLPQIEATYVDFLDWALDARLQVELRRESVVRF